MPVSNDIIQQLAESIAAVIDRQVSEKTIELKEKARVATAEAGARLRDKNKAEEHLAAVVAETSDIAEALELAVHYFCGTTQRQKEQVHEAVMVFLKKRKWVFQPGHVWRYPGTLGSLSTHEAFIKELRVIVHNLKEIRNAQAKVQNAGNPG